MKNLLLWIFFISVICSSCKKDNNLTQDDQTSELFYKSKLVKTVNLTEIKTSEISSKPNTLKLKFDSYKEMYDAFQFIENGTVFSKADVLKRTSAPIGTQAALTNPETITNYYSLFVNDNATSGNTWGTTNIGASYSVSTSISFVKKNASYAVNINSSTATPPSLGYSGVGSIEGSMPSPNWLSSNSSGNFATNVTGYVSIQGTSLSFYINIRGSYYISPPSDPSGQAIVTHYLSADAH